MIDRSLTLRVEHIGSRHPNHARLGESSYRKSLPLRPRSCADRRSQQSAAGLSAGETFGQRFRRGQETCAELCQLGRPSVSGFDEVRRPAPSYVSWGDLRSAVSTRSGDLRRAMSAGETFGQRFRRGQETCAELCQLGRPSVSGFDEVRRPAPSYASWEDLRSAVSTRSGDLRRAMSAGETFGQRFRRGQETCAELCQLGRPSVSGFDEVRRPAPSYVSWGDLRSAVSTRSGDLRRAMSAGETFGQRFRRGQETCAELESFVPRLCLALRRFQHSFESI